MTDLENRILEIFAKEARRDKASLNLDTTLEDLDLESLDILQILFDIEEEFDVYIPYNDESFKLDTLRDVVDGMVRLIAEKQTEAPPAA